MALQVERIRQTIYMFARPAAGRVKDAFHYLPSWSDYVKCQNGYGHVCTGYRLTGDNGFLCDELVRAQPAVRGDIVAYPVWYVE